MFVLVVVVVLDVVECRSFFPVERCDELFKLGQFGTHVRISNKSVVPTILGSPICCGTCGCGDSNICGVVIDCGGGVDVVIVNVRLGGGVVGGPRW